VKKHQHKQFRVEDESIWRRDTTFAGMESSETTQDASGDPSTPASTAATFESMRGLLQSKDDTSRFVGLALLKSVLDNGQLGQNPTQLKILWEAISPKFLDRLLHTASGRIKERETAICQVWPSFEGAHRKVGFSITSPGWHTKFMQSSRDNETYLANPFDYLQST